MLLFNFKKVSDKKIVKPRNLMIKTLFDLIMKLNYKLFLFK